MLGPPPIDRDPALRRIARAARWLVAFLVVLRASSTAHAEPATAAAGVEPRCEAAYQLGQEKEAAGRLKEASQHFAACSDSACDPEIWQACVEANGEVLAVLPSIVPFAVDADDTPRTDVRVQIDGAPVAARLAGVAIALDPGVHQVSFSVRGRVIASERITLEEGERSRPLAVSCPALAESWPPADAETSPSN